MIVVGLSGGIGCGKSTVSTILAELGAVIIDADAITRELQQPGMPLLDALSERFGDHIINDDGSLNRQAVANIVFNDKQALLDLNAITHPVVSAEIARRMQQAEELDQIVVLDNPLLADFPRRGFSGVVMVDMPVELQVERLVRFRGMDEADARARIANQASREKRNAMADRLIDNTGTVEALRAQVHDIWEWMHTLPPGDATAGRLIKGDDVDDKDGSGNR